MPHCIAGALPLVGQLNTLELPNDSEIFLVPEPVGNAKSRPGNRHVTLERRTISISPSRDDRVDKIDGFRRKAKLLGGHGQ